MVPRRPRERDPAAGANGLSAVRNPLRGTVAPRSCPALSRGGDAGVSRSRVVPVPFAKTLPARMTSRHEKERAKQIQEKCQNLLTQMLRDEDNKYCVDCDAKGLLVRPSTRMRLPSLPSRRKAVVLGGSRSALLALCRPPFAPRSWLVDIDHGTTHATRRVPYNAPRRYGFLISAWHTCQRAVTR